MPRMRCGHPVGVEALELLELLAGRRVEDRLAGHRLDAERGAAAGVAVELGHQDAVELGRLGELLGDVDGVLAGHRVDDEEDVVRLRPLLDLGELLHQLGVDVEAAGGVDDQHVEALASAPGRAPTRRCRRGRGRCPASRRSRRPARRAAATARPRPAAGCRRRRRRRAFSSPIRCLASFAVAVVLPEPCRPAIRITVGGFVGEDELAAGAAHQLRELLVDDLDDHLAGVEALEHAGADRLLADVGDELLGDLEVDVGLEQREADLAHRLVDVGLAQLPARAQVRERALEAI